ACWKCARDGLSGRTVEAELAAELKNVSRRGRGRLVKTSRLCGIRTCTNALSSSRHNGLLRAAESAAFFRGKNLEKSRSDNMLRLTNLACTQRCFRVQVKWRFKLPLEVIRKLTEWLKPPANHPSRPPIT